MYKFAIMLKFFVFFYINFIISIDFVNSNNILVSGPNVCNKTVNVTEMFANYTYKLVACNGTSARCFKNITKIVEVEYVPYIKLSHILSCCENYTENEKKDQCVPLCIDKCIHGECVAPNNCYCDPGYEGHSCNKPCETNKWGTRCLNHCKCLNNATCNSINGKCNCSDGYIGENCAQKCPDGLSEEKCASTCSTCKFYEKCDFITGDCICNPGCTGNLCRDFLDENAACNKCHCENGGECDIKTNECLCKPGFQGDMCQCKHECPKNTYGQKCSQTCNCSEKYVCDSVLGCLCRKEFKGKNCSCLPNSYGKKCEKNCPCTENNTISCDPVNGKCNCKVGWVGDTCNTSCSNLKYGKDCNKKCECFNGASCSPVDGKCFCRNGFQGEFCEKICYPGTYGKNCLQQCTCQNYVYCSPDEGVCYCRAGWKGINCSESCDSMEYGANCADKCLCKNEGVCNNINGFCTCAIGWEGAFCERPCKKWYYGNCSKECKCNKMNSFMCDLEGLCDCKEGWKGPRCESRCSNGFFGKNCEERCTCMNNATCNIQNGECDCSSGFVGRNCEIPFKPNVLDVCSKGSYGQSCQEKCLIISKTTYKDNFYYCEPNTASILCKPGYIGLKCEETCPTGLYGYNCRLKCNCNESQSCAPDTGTCLMVEQTYLTTLNVCVIVLSISLVLLLNLYCLCARHKKVKKNVARPQSKREKLNTKHKETSETINVINFNIASKTNQNNSKDEAYGVHEVENLEHVYQEITFTNEDTYDHLNYILEETSIKSHYQNLEFHTFN